MGRGTWDMGLLGLDAHGPATRVARAEIYMKI